MQTISDQTSFSTLAILIAPGSSANSYNYYKKFKDLFKKEKNITSLVNPAYTKSTKSVVTSHHLLHIMVFHQNAPSGGNEKETAV